MALTYVFMTASLVGLVGLIYNLVVMYREKREAGIVN
mgnify:FL=1